MNLRTIHLFVALILTLSSTAQSYVSPKPTKIIDLPIAETSELAEVAWFHPREKALIAKQYEKVELGIKVPPSIEYKIQSFFAQNRREKQINPFDPLDIDITAEFSLNNEVVKRVNGFYYEEYYRNLTLGMWSEDTTSYPFRIRFVPEKAGTYEVTISLKTKESVSSRLVTASFTFEVGASDSPGPIVQGSNSKHFKYARSGESFVGVGQEIVGALWNDWNDLETAARPEKFLPVYESMREMHQAKGNFTRFVASPWFLQLEWEALGNYQPKLPHAWEFDRIDEKCNEYGIYYILCTMLHSQLEKRTDEVNRYESTGVRWEDYCYNDEDQTKNNLAHAEKVGITDPIAFFENSNANRLQENYYRYFVARWGYSSALTGWQIMSEVDQITGYRDGADSLGNVIDNAKNREVVNKWAGRMVNYMENELDDKKLKSIAYIVGKNYSSFLWDPEIYKYENMDFLGLHDYTFEVEGGGRFIRNRNMIVRHETVTNLNVGIEFGEIIHPEFQKKMYIYDEFGHTNAIPKVWPDDVYEDPTVWMNNCMDFNFKQDLWFTFASGCGVAGLDWWCSFEKERQDQWKKYFPGLVSFSSSIDFEGVNYASVKERKGVNYISQRWPFDKEDIERSNGSEYKDWDLLEAYIQIDSTQNQGFGWVNNRSFHWANLVDSIECLQPIVRGEEPFARSYMGTPQDDDLTPKPLIIEKESAYFKIYNVNRRTKYVVEFYDTETSEVIQSSEVKSNVFGVLKVYSPGMNPSVRFDAAFKFFEKEGGWR